MQAELPVFFANRFQVVDPAFEAILSSLVLYFNACNSSLKTVIPYVRDPTLKVRAIIAAAFPCMCPNACYVLFLPWVPPSPRPHSLHTRSQHSL